MLSFKKPIFFAILFGAMLSFNTQAMAQSSQDMSLLSEQERAEFTRRLQHTSTSAERAKITAEMNRIVQERRLEQHRQNQMNPQGHGGAQKGGAGH